MSERVSVERSGPLRGANGSDERLRIEAAQRDPSQFGPLYQEHFEVVYAYLARRVSERAEVEDLTAEVFRKALDGLRGYEWQGSPFGAWLLRIAANTLADRVRRTMRAIPGPLPAEPAAQIDGDALERARLFRLVAQLPADQRRVIELRFGEERSTREIAAELGRTEGAVKQLQLRALRSLRERMRSEDA